MSDLLTKISNKYNCDKSDKNHNYTQIYHKFFEKYRHKKFELVEFGFGVGNSTKMWMEYFTKANMTTIDIRRPPTNDELILSYMENKRVEYINANQIDLDVVIPILKKKKPLITIDDASHVAEDQQFTFNSAFKVIPYGSWYIIEDLKCKRNRNRNFPVEAEKTLKVLNEFMRTGIFKSKILTNKQNTFISSNIEEVKIFDKIAFIKKKDL